MTDDLGFGPTLLRSMSSAILLDRRGDVQLGRECRGAVMEWGGVYAQHVRLTGGWRVRLRTDGTDHDLVAGRSSASFEGERFVSDHVCGPISVHQEVAPLASPAGAVRLLTLEQAGPGPRPVVLTSLIEPYLMPVLVEGVRPVELEIETRVHELRLRQRGFALSVRSDVGPSRLYVDRASWRGGRRRGPVDELGVDYDLELPAGEPRTLTLVVLGGVERDLDRGVGPGAVELPSPAGSADAIAAEEAAWFASTPTMSLPDAPELERAYAHARAGLRRLYSRPAEGMTGLVAGYPWYSAFWCRDLAWMLPAVMWLGDLDVARASIATVLAFQATHPIELLAAEPGELPMQLSPGPVFLFGTSDTTLYYPGLVHRLLRHGGPFAELAGWCDALRRAVAWGERRTDPATGLLRHGGEVELVERASRELAKVRYGIDAPDTTIWDSTDRRDHAVDVQGLWYEALRAAAELEARRGEGGEARRLAARSERLAETLRTAYVWDAERYLYDSLRDGAPVRKLRPNALRLVSAGLLDRARSAAAVRRVAESDLSTPWGVRTLAATDPGYAPTAYHDGQVWTIATAWAADAAYAAGLPALGLSYLRTIAARYEAEPYGANECYRGDRAEPFNSCFLLGFSVGPFLSVLFERLWGLAVDAERPGLAVRPAFPDAWHAAALEHLCIGDGEAAIRWEPGLVEVRWSGRRPLSVAAPAAAGTVPPGGRLRLAAR